jgi:hypothetical protein
MEEKSLGETGTVSVGFLSEHRLNWGIDCHLEPVIPVFPSRRNCKIASNLSYRAWHEEETQPGAQVFHFLQNDDDMEGKA